MKCVYCKQNYARSLSIQEIFKLQVIQPKKLCQRCLNNFVFLGDYSVCTGCGSRCEMDFCEECLKWQQLLFPYTLKHTALLQYNEFMKEWFHQFKFNGDYQLAATFSNELKQALQSKKDWLIVPIPVSKERIETRGFNQVEALLTEADIKWTAILEKCVETLAQSKKDRKERLATKQPFQIKEEYKGKLQNKNILIVDDVYTTGRTILHAVCCCQEEIPLKIETLSLAR